MSWVRLDDDFFDNPKLAENGSFAPMCGWQFVCILGYCNRYLTDGRIPKAKAHALVAWEHVGVVTGGSPGLFGVGHDLEGLELCELLCASGHLEEFDEWTYVVHDYLDYQPSRAQVMADRESAAKRQADYRDRKRNAPRDGVTNGVSNTHPVPVPVPVPQVISPNGESRRSEIDQVWKAWVDSTGRSACKLDEKRKRLIAARLKDYPLDDVLAAVQGWARDPWEGRKQQNEIAILLRDNAHMEKFRDLWRQPVVVRAEPERVNTIGGGSPLATALQDAHLSPEHAAAYDALLQKTFAR
jgi:hypothetical protein